MKNYNEVAECVFARSTAIIEQKRQNRKAFIRKASALFPCIVATLLVCIIYGSGLFGFLPSIFNNPPPIIDGTIEGETASQPQESNSDTGTACGTDSGTAPETNNSNNHPNGDNAFLYWNDKKVTASLAELLQRGNSNDIITIYMTCNTDDNYVHNGKTILEYRNERNTLLILFEKLETFVKVGDSLKYGEVLYTTGTPNGEKWTKELYENTVAYYGNEIIQKYIVNGDFLNSTLYNDIISLRDKVEKLQKEFEEARNASVKHTLNNMQKQLSSQSIQSTISSEGDCLFFKISVSAFENMSVDNLALWTFSAQNGAIGDLNSPSND